MTEPEPAHDHLLRAQPDQLVMRAKELFAPGSVGSDPALIERIERRDIQASTRSMILHHRRDTFDMRPMNHDAQLRLLGQQLEIDRFLYDWDRYVERRREIAHG